MNTEEPSYMARVGKVEACPDTIYFDPIVLSNERNITSDFKMAIQRRYGFTDQTDVQKVDFDHFIDTVDVWNSIMTLVRSKIFFIARNWKRLYWERTVISIRRNLQRQMRVSL